MCWSATADLTAGTVLVGLGAVSLACCRRPQDVPLAALPVIFGGHQVVEAFVWWGESGDVSPSSSAAARIVWAAIALCLLPVWVPVSVWCATRPVGGRRIRLLTLVAVGSVVSAVLGAQIIEYGVQSEVLGHTLSYLVGPTHRKPLLFAGYFVAISVPLLDSADRRLKVFGAVVTVGAPVCWLLWRYAFASTWCAFCAVASVMVISWVRNRARPEPAAWRSGRLVG